MEILHYLSVYFVLLSFFVQLSPMCVCLTASFFFVDSELQQHPWKNIQNPKCYFKLAFIGVVFCTVLQTDSWKCIMKPPITFSLSYYRLKTAYGSIRVVKRRWDTLCGNKAKISSWLSFTNKHHIVLIFLKTTGLSQFVFPHHLIHQWEYIEHSCQ